MDCSLSWVLNVSVRSVSAARAWQHDFWRTFRQGARLRGGRQSVTRECASARWEVWETGGVQRDGTRGSSERWSRRYEWIDCKSYFALAASSRHQHDSIIQRPFRRRQCVHYLNFLNKTPRGRFCWISSIKRQEDMCTQTILLHTRVVLSSVWWICRSLEGPNFCKTKVKCYYTQQHP